MRLNVRFDMQVDYLVNLTGCLAWGSVERGPRMQALLVSVSMRFFGLSLAAGGERSKDRQTLCFEHAWCCDLYRPSSCGIGFFLKASLIGLEFSWGDVLPLLQIE